MTEPSAPRSDASSRIGSVDRVRVPLIAPAYRSATLGIAALAWLVAGIMGLKVANERVAGFPDRGIDARVVAELARHRFLVQHLVTLGDPRTVLDMSITLVVAWSMWRPRAAVLAAVSVPAAGGLTEWVIKPLVGRTLEGGLAFPSGHTTGIFSVAFVLLIALCGPHTSPMTRVLAWLSSAVALLLAVAVAAALVAARFHYATDTVAGSCVALGVVLSVSVMVDRVADSGAARRGGAISAVRTWPGSRVVRAV